MKFGRFCSRRMQDNQMVCFQIQQHLLTKHSNKSRYYIYYLENQLLQSMPFDKSLLPCFWAANKDHIYSQKFLFQNILHKMQPGCHPSTKHLYKHNLFLCHHQYNTLESLNYELRYCFAWHKQYLTVSQHNTMWLIRKHQRLFYITWYILHQEPTPQQLQPRAHFFHECPSLLTTKHFSVDIFAIKLYL